MSKKLILSTENKKSRLRFQKFIAEEVHTRQRSFLWSTCPKDIPYQINEIFPNPHRW